MNFATNHLGPFLLTNLLLDIIPENSRIVNVSSGVHSQAHINFDDIGLSKEYSGYQAYGQSKLANILFTKLLAEKLKDKNITVNCLHPGVVHTGIFKKMSKITVGMMRPIMITPKKGAQTSVYLATSDEVTNISGAYFAKEKLVNSSPASCDMELAKKLWDLSVKYVGL